MAQPLMWNIYESNYRGQAANGTVVTVEEEAMELARKNAGKSVYETEWWVETLERVLEHWGIYTQRWVDDATQNRRINFTLEPPKGADKEEKKASEQPSLSHSSSGPLLNRLVSGNLGTKDL